ncbi:hypothetical protein V1509DRAFT_635097 [Lipomyces kononenkoae]
MKRMTSFSSAILLVGLVATTVARSIFKTTTIPSTPGNGAANVQFTSAPFSNLDDAKISHVNSTVWEWWYFDVVSASTNASITIIFYAAGSSGFLLPNASYTPVQIVGSLPNGTVFQLPLFSGSGATISAEQGKQGVSGIWHETGFAFYNRDDFGYTIVLDSEELGVRGDLNFNAIPPAHYPCALLCPRSSQNMELLPGIGWANAVPDAIVTADIAFFDPTTDETLQIKFDDGVGYHDQNWGSVPFVETVQSWYWGHGRIGSYSVVWFDAINWDGSEYQSGYVMNGNHIISVGCNPSSSKVRPFGDGTASTYPPTANSALPSGYTLEFEIPGESDSLIVTVPNRIKTVDFGFYNRWIGHNLSGHIGGRSIGTGGVGVWEQFNLNYQ